MKRLYILFALFIPVLCFGQLSTFQFSLNKLEGGTVLLNSFTGKKILIVTLPLVSSDHADSLLFSLDTLSAHRTAQLQVIAVPSIEDGYTSGNKEQLLIWYRSKLGNQVIISDGLYTHLSSGSVQHPLFKWMTDISQNEVFGIDAAGPGYKYFINYSGELVGVLRSHSTMWGSSVQQALGL